MLKFNNFFEVIYTDKFNSTTACASYSIYKSRNLGFYLLAGAKIIYEIRKTAKLYDIEIKNEDIIEFLERPSIAYKYKNLEELIMGFLASIEFPYTISYINRMNIRKAQEFANKIFENLDNEYSEKTINLNLLNYINNKIWPFLVKQIVDKNIDIESYSFNKNIRIGRFTISEKIISQIYNTDFSSAISLFSNEFFEWCSYNFLRVIKMEVLEDKKESKVLIEI